MVPNVQTISQVYICEINYWGIAKNVRCKSTTKVYLGLFWWIMVYKIVVSIDLS